MSKVVIVGAGQAGSEAATHLPPRFRWRNNTHRSRECSSISTPTIIKKYVIGDMRKERLYLKPESFYHENQIKLRLGLKVKKINRNKKRIETDSVTYDYDQLILTTGSVPNQLPGNFGKTHPGYTTYEILMMQTNSKRYLNQVRLP